MKVNFDKLLMYSMFFKKIKDQKIENIKTSYTLNKLNMIAMEELKFFDKEKEKLLQECGEKNKETGELVIDETTNSIRLKADKTKEFTIKFTELLTTEIEIQDFAFSLEELEHFDLTTEDLQFVMPFLN